MSGTSSSDPPATEAVELEAVISSEREEEPVDRETWRVIDQQAKDESQDNNSKEEVKPKSNKFQTVELLYLDT